MPVRQFIIFTTPTQICPENPQRISLTIKNCTGIGTPTGTYFRLSDNKKDVSVTGHAFLVEPKEILYLRKKDGEHPEKEWWGQSDTGNSCCCIIEQFEVKTPEEDIQEPEVAKDPKM